MLGACERAVGALTELNRVSLHVDADIVPFYHNSGYSKAQHAGFLGMFQSGPIVMTKLM